MNSESPLQTSHLKERHFSGLLDKQMELVDLLPHQRGYRITAGDDALRLSGRIKKTQERAGSDDNKHDKMNANPVGKSKPHTWVAPQIS